MVRTLAVVGAGNMGSGIAQKIATEGFPVILVDLDDEKVARGMAALERTLAEGVERKIFKPDQAAAIRGRVRGTSRFEDLAGADLVVEAVFEDLAVKRDVFRRLGSVCRPDALLGTNTSSFRVAEVAEVTPHPGRVLGLHYFYHPAKNRLVEVVPHAGTDPAATRTAWLLQERIGKTPIASADAPGFVVNRFFVPWLNEAVRLLEEGVADVATIEAAAREAFGIGMGPFQLMNVTGIPIALHAATTLGGAFGPFYAPAAALKAQVDSGRPWDLSGTPDPSRAAVVADRLLAVAWMVAGELVEEGVGTVEDTDLGARVGLRWPAGPFELMNRRGVPRAAEKVAELAARWDRPVPGLLRARTPFAFRLVKTETADGIATLTLNRPDAMNALNEAVVGQLHAALDAAAADPAVRGIVIAGTGKAFIAGADIRFFVERIEGGKIPEIVSFTEAGHALLAAIERCPKPVVARVQGLALGGGLELALACHRIVASDRAMLAFPETGIGIYPGLGGTQRAPRRVGRGLARWLVFTGQMLGAAEARAIGLVDDVAPLEELDAAVRRAVEAGTRPSRPALAPAHAALERFFAAADPEALRAGTADTGGDEALGKAMKRVAPRAPIALRLAGSLIDDAGRLPLAEGLGRELAHLPEIFSTRDALAGLKSVGGRPPAYEGR